LYLFNIPKERFLILNNQVKSGKKILLVDDDVELTEELAEILKEAGYEVDFTSDSHEGVQKIQNHTYDLYLLDYKMSGVDGVFLFILLREKYPESKVFIISGNPFIENILTKENILPFLKGVIKKPFDIEKLLEQIRLCF
jgi:DNA-binding response OmpR family regulator